MAIYEPGTPVSVFSNGHRLPATVVRYEPDEERYIVRMQRSGEIWNASGLWVKPRAQGRQR